jgi:hypothetical protein
VKHPLLVIAAAVVTAGWAANLWGVFDMWIRLERSGAVTAQRPILADKVGFVFWIAAVPAGAFLFAIAAW